MVVIVVLAIVTMYAVTHTAVLHHLRAELRLIETEQVKKLDRP
jgi:hypothetical protein